jgi:type II secretory pathway component GspD/PulD (secretin)
MFLMKRCCCVFFLLAAWLAAEPATTPLPADIAARLAARAANARVAASTVRAYLLYKEAAALDPLNPRYRENRDELEPLAKLLLSQHLEDADIQPDIAACKLEATPGEDASIAVRLAEKAEQARKAGQAVRAYLLYNAAANQYPGNLSYRENANVLTPVASLLQSSQLEIPDISADLKAARLESLSGSDPAIKAAGADWRLDNSLAALPHIKANQERHDFDLRGDPSTLIRQVTSVYGVQAINDPDLPKTGKLSFHITDADFRTAMDGLTAVTNTFVFPVASQVLFFAEDTEAKRNELEPNILLTVSLPDSLNDKDLIDAANGVRSVLNLKNFGWDAATRTVMIRDRFTRAHLAKSLLESLLVPHAQIALELQFITLDSTVSYEWGITPQNTFQLVSPLQKLFNFNTILPTLISGAKYIAVGGGASIFGIGVTSAQLLATYSKSKTNTSYDTTVVVSDGQTANLHVGEKYPIPTSLYTGASQTASSIYNPIGTVTQEDLGLVLKVTPHVKGDGEVGMDIEADYKSLGAQTFNTVPAVAEREFKGSVTLQPDQWAVLAGLDQTSKLSSRDGLAGLSDIPLLNQVVSDNNRTNTDSRTLIVLKPFIQRLPMSDAITPQFLVGPVRGVRVLL